MGLAEMISKLLFNCTWGDITKIFLKENNPSFQLLLFLED
jgi:hypothetical protein